MIIKTPPEQLLFLLYSLAYIFFTIFSKYCLNWLKKKNIIKKIVLTNMKN